MADTSTNAPYGPKSSVAYADPGYQPDKRARYPVDTAAHAKAAYSYISQDKNAKLYTGPQLKRIRGRIKGALKRFGVTVAAEGWSVDPAVLVTEAVAEYAGMDPECAGSYSLSATNGPTTVTVCSWGLDPADLMVILQQACKGAGLALMSLDPDMDADIDVPGADAEDADGDTAPGTSLPDNGDGVDPLVARLMAAIRGESAEDPAAVLAEAMAAVAPAVTETAPEEDPAPEPAAADREETEAPAMSETTTTETAATAPASYSQADLDGAIGAALARAEEARKARKAAKRAAAPAEAAPAGAVTETEDERIGRIVAERIAAARAAAVVAETDEQRVNRIVEERMVAERQRLTEQGGGPGRKGLSRGSVTENAGAQPAAAGLNKHGLPSDWPDKPIHEFTGDEMEQFAGPVITRHVLGAKADLLA